MRVGIIDFISTHPNGVHPEISCRLECFRESTRKDDVYSPIQRSWLIGLDKLPKGCKMNGQDFCNVVLEEAKRSVTAITRKS
jgi:hypothetical protein